MDLAAVGPDYLIDYREPQPAAALFYLAHARSIDAVKRLEDQLLLPFGDAEAEVPHRDPDRARSRATDDELALFIAQAVGVQLSLGDQLTLLAVLLLTSKGAAGVTGSGFITLAATLAALHGKVPVEGVALILGVDRFMSEARALTNLIGNGVATMFIARWEGLRDDARMRAALDTGPGGT